MRVWLCDGKFQANYTPQFLPGTIFDLRLSSFTELKLINPYCPRSHHLAHCLNVLGEVIDTSSAILPVKT
jgi:hypothetical protein